MSLSSVKDKAKNGSADHQDLGDQWTIVSDRRHQKNCRSKSKNDRKSNPSRLALLQLCTFERHNIVIFFFFTHCGGLDFNFGKNLQSVFLEYFQLVVRAQETQAVDHWNHIIGRFAGVFADGAAGAGGFGAEQNLIDAALFDSGFQVVHVIDARIKEQVLAEIALADMVIVGDEAV